MPTLFAVYNLVDKQQADEYDKYLTNTKIPGIRSAPWCTAFDTWKIDKTLAPAVSEPEGGNAFRISLYVCCKDRSI
jgi:hypothetical protein